MLSDATVAAIDTAGRAELEAARQPGLALGVTDRDGTLAIRTYGLADVGAGAPVRPLGGRALRAWLSGWPYYRVG
jgi:hypothetical protein